MVTFHHKLWINFVEWFYTFVSCKIVTIIIVPSCNLWSIHHRFMLNSSNYTKVLVSDFLWKNSCKLVSDANMSKMSWSGIHCYSHFSNTATHSHIQDSKSGERQPYRSREPYILPFFQKEKQLTKFPGPSLQPVTINLIEHYILRVFVYFWCFFVAGGPVTATAREVELPKVNDMQCAIFYDIEIDTRMCAGHNLNDMGICSVRHFNIIEFIM